ncbi:unnamed protein product [Heterobilharzia americana]|nr:unnamed protein product [Heterobilharzia americana]
MQQSDNFRVAIVGGGIGGVSSAYYLRQLFGKNVSIALFEKSGRIGGRMKTVPFCGEICESGASLIHSSNRYMMSFARKFKLPIKKVIKTNHHLFLFDVGYKQVFSDIHQKPNNFTSLRLLVGYGYSTLLTNIYITRKLHEFKKIYHLQDQGNCFDSPALLLKSLSSDFPEMTKFSYGDWLRKRIKSDDKYLNEILFGVLSNNYCQGLDVHGFVGVVSSACTTGVLHSVDGGVEQIPQKLVETALADNPVDVPKEFIHAEVKKITKTDDHKLRLSYELASSNKTEEASFDYVILAIPLHQESNLLTSADINLPKIQYHEMCRTFLSGNINYSLFGLPPKSLENHHLASFLPVANYCLHEKHPVRSIMHLPVKPTNTEAPDGIWSIFSEPKSIPDPKTFLSNLILKDPNDEENRVDVIRWLAYPKYHPVADPYTDLGQFKLAPGVYYPNAIELAASCMEMAIIGGRNVALMIAKERIPPVDSLLSKVSNFMNNFFRW